MKVLLLGAAGTLGSRIVPALLAHKHQVVVYVRSESKLKGIIPTSILSEVTVIIGDATDSSSISNALVKHQCNALVNSAGQANLFPWQAPRLQGIIHAITAAAIEASQKLGYPIRAWFLGGFGALDHPGRRGTTLVNYFPMFPEHGLTYAHLSAQPPKNLEWSLICPSMMSPVSTNISLSDGSRNNPLIASADIPPDWRISYLESIPFLGSVWSVLMNAPRYSTKLEDCADFIAADLEKPNPNFVGHRVGIYDTGKGQT